MKRYQFALTIFLFSIYSCKERTNIEHQKNVAQNELQKQAVIILPSSYYSDIDTVIFQEKNRCYIRPKQQKQKHAFEPVIEGDLTFAYFQQADTLTIQMLVETIENKMGQLQTDTLICLYKVYPDSLIPILSEKMTPVKGNRMYLRQSGTYRRITN